MLWILFVVLCSLWLLALLNGTTLGGFIHIFLVVAIVVILYKFYQDRKLRV